ncbi:MAG: peroxiredoxin [Candidatus Woesearchaeota archaeon]
MIKIDYPAPDFFEKSFCEDEIKKISLSDFRGKWVVLFFYPADFTFVCPTELNELSKRYEELRDMNVEVISISTDSPYVHKAWKDSSHMIKNIQFPMLSDPTGKVSRAYDVMVEHEGFSQRATFIIDPDGMVKTIEIHNNDIGRNADELIRKLHAAQHVRNNSDEACPASWNPGKETLKVKPAVAGKA